VPFLEFQQDLAIWKLAAKYLPDSGKAKGPEGAKLTLINKINKYPVS
jgi:hypothetical protein